MKTIEQALDQLEENGHILVEGALSPEETEHVRQRINHAREMGWADGLNQVGNMWFDTLLDREPETFAPLVGHPGIRPYLEGHDGQAMSIEKPANPHQPGRLPSGVASRFLRVLEGEAGGSEITPYGTSNKHQYHILFSG